VISTPAWGTPPPSRDPSDPERVTEPVDALSPSWSVSGADQDARRSADAGPAGRRTAVGLVAVLVVAVVLPVAAWLVLRPGSTGPSSSGTASTAAVDMAEPVDVWSVGLVPQVVDDLVEIAGGAQFVAIDLYPTHVSAKAPTAPGVTTIDRYSWRDGRAAREGPTSDRLDVDELFDVTTVEWTSVEGLVAQVRNLTGIDDASTSVSVERVSAGAPVRLRVYAGDDYGRHGIVTATAMGEIVWMKSDIEGSPAFEWEAAGLFPVERTQQAIDDLVEVVGGTQFVEVYVRRTSVSAKAPTTPGATTFDGFTWRDGFVERNGAAPRSPRDESMFDITTVDWAAVEGLVAQVPDLTGISDDSPYVVARRKYWSEDRHASTPTVLGVMVSDDYYSAYITADATGKIVWMEGGAPGSPAAQW